jgi:prefoldin subunit 5
MARYHGTLEENLRKHLDDARAEVQQLEDDLIGAQQAKAAKIFDRTINLDMKPASYYHSPQGQAAKANYAREIDEISSAIQRLKQRLDAAASRKAHIEAEWRRVRSM